MNVESITTEPPSKAIVTPLAHEPARILRNIAVPATSSEGPIRRKGELASMIIPVVLNLCIYVNIWPRARRIECYFPGYYLLVTEIIPATIRVIVPIALYTIPPTLLRVVWRRKHTLQHPGVLSSVRSFLLFGFHRVSLLSG